MERSEPPSGELAPSEREQLEGLAAAVRASPHNLLSERAVARLWERHIPECVALARQLPAGVRVLDVGTGGGFPGLVMAICRPDLQVEMAEATGKKATFLRETASALALENAVIHGVRAESLARDDGEEEPVGYDVVTARAVAKLPALVELTAPLLAPGGSLWAVKGARWPDELEAAAETIEAADLYVAGLPARYVDTDENSAPRVVIISRRADAGDETG